MTKPAAPPLPLDALRLRERLAPLAPALRVECLAETGSTNDRALEHLRAAVETGDPPTPLLVTAERQSAGRGRQGRSWWSPPGLNLLFSLALPLPERSAFTPTAFNLAAAAIVCDQIERRSPLHPAIKWPNDVHVGQRKLAGILSELVLAGPGTPGAMRRPRGIVVGIGVNVNVAAADFPEDLRETAGSLRQLSGAPWDREDLLVGIAGALMKLAAGRRPDTWHAVADAWRARCDTLGRWVTVAAAGDRIEGTAQGLEEDGALVIRTPEGTLRRIEGGEVTLEKT